MSIYIQSIPTPARTLTQKEQADILNATGQRRGGFRDHMIIAIALGTGLREHEIVALDIGDVFDDEGHARRRVVLRVFKRSAARPAIQEVILPDNLRTKLVKFYGWKLRKGEPLAPDAPLFLSNRKTRISTRQLRNMFHKWQQAAGFERLANFHILRHTACTNVYKSTKDIRITQRFARHKSILMTMRYSHPDEADLARAVDRIPC